MLSTPRIILTASAGVYSWHVIQEIRGGLSPHKFLGNAGFTLRRKYTAPILTSPMPGKCLFEIYGMIYEGFRSVCTNLNYRFNILDPI